MPVSSTRIRELLLEAEILTKSIGMLDSPYTLCASNGLYQRNINRRLFLWHGQYNAPFSLTNGSGILNRLIEVNNGCEFIFRKEESTCSILSRKYNF